MVDTQLVRLEYQGTQPCVFAVHDIVTGTAITKYTGIKIDHETASILNNRIPLVKINDSIYRGF